MRVIFEIMSRKNWWEFLGRIRLGPGIREKICPVEQHIVSRNLFWLLTWWLTNCSGESGNLSFRSSLEMVWICGQRFLRDLDYQTKFSKSHLVFQRRFGELAIEHGFGNRNCSTAIFRDVELHLFDWAFAQRSGTDLRITISLCIWN